MQNKSFLIGTKTYQPIVKLFNDGTHIVQLDTAHALHAEEQALDLSFSSQNQLERFKKGHIKKYSLRNSKHLPSVIISIENNTVQENQALRGWWPNSKHVFYLEKFFKKNNYILDTRTSYTGIVDVSGQYYSIHDIPDNVHIPTLDLTDCTNLDRLPENLQVDEITFSTTYHYKDTSYKYSLFSSLYQYTGKCVFTSMPNFKGQYLRFLQNLRSLEIESCPKFQWEFLLGLKNLENLKITQCPNVDPLELIFKGGWNMDEAQSNENTFCFKRPPKQELHL